MTTERKTWRRSRDGRWVAGICAGLAHRLGWKVSIVRTVWLICTVIPVLPGLPAYLVLWIFLPADGAESKPFSRARTADR
ncbi:MAG: PspC domain-containing protein [Thermoanaerobaculia bacterium]|nr:PspC domain-containing protein [Thermoanaerobaculia bacterium]